MMIDDNDYDNDDNDDNYNNDNNDDNYDDDDDNDDVGDDDDDDIVTSMVIVREGFKIETWKKLFCHFKKEQKWAKIFTNSFGQAGEG